MLKREDFTPQRIDEIIAEARRHGPYDAMTHEEREESRQHFLSAHGEDGLWVFGYGSLLWNPAFHFEKSEPAKLYGYHRKFCLRLSIGRGSPENPDLMLALDSGGSCNGRAFYVAKKDVESETKILWMREMLSGAYKANWCKIKTQSGMKQGLTFVINRQHRRYIKGLELDKTIELLGTGIGYLGSCREYLENTIDHLDEINVKDQYLHFLRDQVQMKFPISQKK
ncbi:MAG: gamma-glutamylcyclotransferase [Sneathiella sp.]|nr:gamma-glutamylcyclotransferase [Sneathiella sp.]